MMHYAIEYDTSGLACAMTWTPEIQAAGEQRKKERDDEWERLYRPRTVEELEARWRKACAEVNPPKEAKPQ